MERPSPYVANSLTAWLDALRVEPKTSLVYKPALLLVVVDAIESGSVDPSRVVLDERLTRAFHALLTRAGLRAQKGVVWKPFFFLGTTARGRRPIWTLHDASGAPLTITHAEEPGSVPALQRRVAYASFAPELAAPLRQSLGRVGVRALLYDSLELRQHPDALNLLHAHDRDWSEVEEVASEVREALDRPFRLHVQRPLVELSERTLRIRDRGFRHIVIPQYKHRCAACDLRLRCGSLYEAEAAHIVPVSADGDDDVRNALSLCRTHHWAFDHGLWTVNDDRRIAVVDAAEREGIDAEGLRTMHGRELRAPDSPRSAPHSDALAWHRRRWGSNAA